MSKQKRSAKAGRDLGLVIMQISKMLYHYHQRAFLMSLLKTLQREIDKLFQETNVS